MEKEYKSGELGIESKPIKTKGCLISLGLFIFFVVLVSSCAKPEPEDSALNAYLISQEFVSDQLKSPSTAKFPPYSESFITDWGKGKYVVNAYVDAQNLFGAVIRNNYRITVTCTGDKNWISENLRIWQ